MRCNQEEIDGMAETLKRDLTVRLTRWHTESLMNLDNEQEQQISIADNETSQGILNDWSRCNVCSSHVQSSYYNELDVPAQFTHPSRTFVQLRTCLKH
jgi:hypothetical protein